MTDHICANIRVCLETGVTHNTLIVKLIQTVMVDRAPNYGDVDILNFQQREYHMVFCISQSSYDWPDIY